MSEQLAKQLQLQRSIERAMDNFKKIGRNNLTAAKVRTRIASLKEQFQDGHAILTQVIPASTQSTLEYFKLGQYDRTEDIFNSTWETMAENLEELEPVVSPNPSLSASRLQSDSSAFSLQHLPPIKLPPYDGNSAEWEQFRDRFTSLIRNNPELTDFARMHFLSSCLKGRAAECIADIPVTANNFEVAWNALNSRYENKRRLLKVHLATLTNLTTITRESAADLQTLRDKVSHALASLKNLNRTPKNLWNDILVHLIVQNLDPVTRKAWNVKIGDTDAPPSYDDLSRFLISRSRALDDCATTSAVRPAAKSATTSKVHATTASASAQSKCPLCKSQHYINICPTFISRNASQRRELVKQHNRCFNCLSARHAAKDCRSKYSCRVCARKHHSMLHLDSDSGLGASENASPSCSSPQSTDKTPEVKSLSASTTQKNLLPVLLATAWVTVSVASGRTAVVRALIDQGSETTFISERLAQTLRAKRKNMPISISAVGGINAGTCQHVTEISISPRATLTPSYPTTALILKSLTSYNPKRSADVSSLSYLTDLPLADADPTSSDPISLIIGADLYSEIILSGVRKGGSGQPLAQNSVLGWIISGPVNLSAVYALSPTTVSASQCSRLSVSAHHVVGIQSLEDELRRFWEVEELPRQSLLTPQERQCEKHFSSTHTRDPDGRYVVRLPFKENPPLNIGNSKRRAEMVLDSVIRKLRDKPEVAREYRDFLSEYERLGHMQPASTSTYQSEQFVYLPHHGVIRDGSATTHLRVVFNASSLTSNGTSLNDHVHAGPKLQTDISSIILQWRRYKYVYSSDIAKMYRQIRVDSRDINYQRILWKPSPLDAVLEYQLLTVTYGMSCAPFLALRVLKQLVVDEGHHFPLAVPILRENIYVDDVLFGADNPTLIRQARDQLISILRRGGFELRKWASNSPTLLEDIDPADHGLAAKKPLAPDEQLKILGIGWTPSTDSFEFRVALADIVPTTKRTILSAIARLYDPLGWVTPVIIAAKIFMQQLWRLKIGWDDVISDSPLDRWTEIYSRLLHLGHLKIPRWTEFGAEACRAEIHGFADASNQAYAAAVYVRVVSSSGQTTITLLIGKAKVAPVKSLSIPRLELSAALLLARLIDLVRGSSGYKDLPYYCWTDSTIVLAWLAHSPSRWRTFVANRVSEIQSLLPHAVWRHVSTDDNPADCASRGLFGDEIIHHALWWYGPPWLRLDAEQWPDLDTSRTPEAPLEEKVLALQCNLPHEPWDLATKYSSWPKLIRVTAYLIKFVSLCRCHRSGSDSPTASIVPGSCPYPAPNSTSLSAIHCQRAKTFWIRHIQAESFPAELHSLSNNHNLSSRSSLLSLNPFLDRDGVLRVGGRLRQAPLPFPTRHPILLGSHPLVTLIVRQAHLRALHAGPQLTLNILRRDFWIIRARNIVKSVIHNCVVCIRDRAAAPTQIMGNLPEPRVAAATRSFLHCGLDYAGPVQIRASAGRGITARKAYLALFVCLATKAIHLELVGDYSTQAFLNAYSRFCARRGLPQAMYSDNGTTFVGADRDMTLAYRSALQDPNFLNVTATDNVTWNFIPPSAPHFGGLWEAGVRSVKTHLRRVLSTHLLTFEEFSTLLCRIEACLNSRPIAPFSDTLEDYEPLTPGHFLVGSALTVNPEPSLLDLNENRLSRWQLVRHMTERFWKLWSTDYVNTLQQRSKWRKVRPQIQPGQLVLLRNATLPPCKWELGRVTRCHPGPDGFVRVVTVKTAASEYRRPIVKLCVLPVKSEATSN